MSDMAKGRPKKEASEKAAKANGGASLGFEAQMFLAADKLRKNLEPSDYKHVVLGLIFLKYVSTAFEAKHAALVSPAGKRPAADHWQADRRRDDRDREVQ